MALQYVNSIDPMVSQLNVLYSNLLALRHSKQKKNENKREKTEKKENDGHISHYKLNETGCDLVNIRVAENRRHTDRV